MNLIQVFQKFPTQESCIEYLEKKRWNNEPYCPYCESTNTKQTHNMNQPKYFPSHIANFFLWLSRNDRDKKCITNMKLVKLTYFSYAWHYALYKEKLFSELVEAWDYGPVVPSIYHEFKRFGKSTIDTYAVENKNPFDDNLYYPMINASDTNTVSVLNAVWDSYKNKDGEELSEITHQANSPWGNVFERGKNKALEMNDIESKALEAMKKYKTFKENR